ncbi:MAG: hypothetical protein IKQ39_03225 [Oscillospiraceae bacterium]|nr:hypothetical protein [Oscillospiraceae bacterium]
MRKFCLLISLVLLVLSIAFLMEFPKWQKWKNNDIKDFNAVKAGELMDGDLVRGTIDRTYGAIAEREESRKTFGITTSKSTTMQYYAVIMDNGQYVLYGTSDSSDYATLDRIADRWQELFEKYQNGEEYSEDDVPTETISFEGEVRSLPSDLNNIFQEWYGEGYSTDCENAIYVVRTDYSRFNWIIYVGIACAAGTVLLWIVCIVMTVKGKKKAQYGY